MATRTASPVTVSAAAPPAAVKTISVASVAPRAQAVAQTPSAAGALGYMQGHTTKRYALQHDWAARAVRSSVPTAALIASGRGAEVWAELVRLQQAFARQQVQLANKWFQGLDALCQEWQQLAQANTIAKMAEQELDLAANFGQLCSDQVTGLVTLIESVEVAYGYWASQAQ
jgi:hypothetical protein